jgi:beta-barrel assembly-enhancing protease
MRRTVAALLGCLLMLSSSWSFALGSAAQQGAPQGAPTAPSEDSSQSSTSPSPASGPAADASSSQASSATASQANPGSTANSSATAAGPAAPQRNPYNPYRLYPDLAPPVPAAPPPIDESQVTLGTGQLPAGDLPQTESSDTSLFGSLPDLGGPADATISRGEESEVGQMLIKQVRDAHMLLDDPEVKDYLQGLGMRLASEAHDPDQQFHYECMKDPQINSFATFGGYIFIYTGLILITQNEAELAAVMAHETGHVVQRHIARDLLAQSHMSIANIAAMLAAVAIGVAGRGNNGEAAEGAMAMAQAVEFQKSINFTRGEEIEADYVGIHLLAAAGFDPYEMAAMFEQLGQTEGLQGGEIPAILQDHPVTPERIAAARARAAQFPRLAHYSESQSYAFIKERVRVLSATADDHVAEYYARLSAARPLTPAERYGQALVQMQDGQAALAVGTLRELRNRYPELVLLYSALGQALAGAGQMHAALAEFNEAEELFPRNVPLTVHYAETLMKAGKPQQAHQVLLDLFNLVDPTPPQIQLTALAANAAGDTADAYYYMGEYNLANGDLGLANQELELALRMPHLSNVQRERYRALLLQVREWMREQQQARHGG